MSGFGVEPAGRVRENVRPAEAATVRRTSDVSDLPAADPREGGSFDISSLRDKVLTKAEIKEAIARSKTKWFFQRNPVKKALAESNKYLDSVLGGRSVAGSALPLFYSQEQLVRRNATDDTAVHMAIKNVPDLARKLIELLPAEQLIISGENKKTPLMLAIEHKDTRIMEQLVSKTRAQGLDAQDSLFRTAHDLLKLQVQASPTNKFLEKMAARLEAYAKPANLNNRRILGKKYAPGLIENLPWLLRADAAVKTELEYARNYVQQIFEGKEPVSAIPFFFSKELLTQVNSAGENILVVAKRLGYKELAAHISSLRERDLTLSEIDAQLEALGKLPMDDERASRGIAELQRAKARLQSAQ
ncbi:MAG: hypothetical protein V4534_00800 [Myxococcota bacterium]